MVIGNSVICLDADKYSSVDRCPFHAKKAPMATDVRSVMARTTYSQGPNKEWRSDKEENGHSITGTFACANMPDILMNKI